MKGVKDLNNLNDVMSSTSEVAMLIGALNNGDSSGVKLQEEYKELGNSFQYQEG